MRLTLAEPRFLKDSISIISDLVNEARFKVKKDSIELVAMDPANVAMVVFKLLSTSFAEYDVKKDTEIAINLSNLKQILRRALPSDMLTLEVGKDNRLLIQFKGVSVRKFSIPIIELEEKEQKVPELDFPIRIKMPSSVLNNAVEDSDVVAESVTFSLEPGRFTINAEGDLSKAEIEIKEGEGTEFKTSAKEKISARYSVEYLKKMISGSKLADTVVIQFNKDYPLKLEYTELNKLQLIFILAPRVEND